MITKLGGRKFAFAIVAVVIAGFLAALSRIDARTFLGFVEVVGFTYVVGNAAEHIAKK